MKIQITSFIFLLTLVVSCRNPEDLNKIKILENRLSSVIKKNDSLTSRIIDIENTPQSYLNKLLNETDLDSIMSQSRNLIQTYPNSDEAIRAEKIIDETKKKIEIKNKERDRLASLTFSKVKKKRSFKSSDCNYNVKSISKARRWIIDRYESRYHYIDADKGSFYYQAKVTISTENKYPDHSGFAIYKRENDKLFIVGYMQMRYSRWDDYSSYLGSTADYSNDFAKTNSINFDLGLEINSYGKKIDYYLVASKSEIVTQKYKQFENPPYYFERKSNMENVLTPQDLESNYILVATF